MLQVATPLISKLSATGNDFLIIEVDTPLLEDQWKAAFSKWPRARVAQRLCNRFDGIGADGMLFMHASREADWGWEFYNQDGSHAEMCGNAARCAGLWAARQAGEWRHFTFKTPAGIVSAQRLSERRIEVTMPKVQVIAEKLKLNVQGQEVSIDWLNSGVPHALVTSPTLDPTPQLKAWAAELRHHSHFGKSGANVTFVVHGGKSLVSTMTFERGVEDFTRSCGTGAVAAAFRHGRAEIQTHINVEVLGGRLEVDLSHEQPRLIGPAHWVADCQVHVHDDGVLVP